MRKRTRGPILYMSVLPSFARLSLDVAVKSTREKQITQLEERLRGQGDPQGAIQRSMPKEGTEAMRSSGILQRYGSNARPEFGIRPVQNVPPLPKKKKSRTIEELKKTSTSPISSRNPRDLSRDTLLLLRGIRAKQLLRYVELNLKYLVQIILYKMGFKIQDDLQEFTLQEWKKKDFVNLYEKERESKFRHFVNKSLYEYYRQVRENPDESEKTPPPVQGDEMADSAGHSSDVQIGYDEFVTFFINSDFEPMAKLSVERLKHIEERIIRSQDFKNRYFSVYDKKYEQDELNKYEEVYISKILKHGKPKRAYCEFKIKELRLKLNEEIRLANSVNPLHSAGQKFVPEKYSLQQAYSEYKKIKSLKYRSSLKEIEEGGSEESLLKFIPKGSSDSKIQEARRNALVAWPYVVSEYI